MYVTSRSMLSLFGARVTRKRTSMVKLLAAPRMKGGGSAEVIVYSAFGLESTMRLIAMRRFTFEVTLTVSSVSQPGTTQVKASWRGVASSPRNAGTIGPGGLGFFAGPHAVNARARASGALSEVIPGLTGRCTCCSDE